MATSGMEYKNKKDETPFETFLRYSNEKEESSTRLADLLQEIAGDLSILDIGAGNGEFLALTLAKTKNLTSLRVTLLEPSRDLVKQLKDHFNRILPRDSVKIIRTTLDDFSNDEKFDVILASHLFYHIPRDTWVKQLNKMLSFLKPDGRLIIILREKDDAYRFKMAFKPLILDKNFKALVIDDVLTVLPEVSKLRVSRYSIASELRVPIDKNVEDAISIIEFYLNEHWQNITERIQKDIFNFIKARNSIFKQLDGIAVIKKK